MRLRGNMTIISNDYVKELAYPEIVDGEKIVRILVKTRLAYLKHQWSYKEFETKIDMASDCYLDTDKLKNKGYALGVVIKGKPYFIKHDTDKVEDFIKELDLNM